MDEFIQLFGGIPLSTAVIFIAAVSFLIAAGLKVYRFLVKIHDTYQDKNKSLEVLKRKVEELVETPSVSRVEWKELKDKQDNLEVILNKILVSQEKLVKRQDAFEEESRSHNLNKLRDRLLQSYRYYTSEEKNPRKEWSEMEKEAFYSLLNDYYSLGGNSFIKEVVEPAMEGLVIISMLDADRITQLMKSRKG